MYSASLSLTRKTVDSLASSAFSFNAKSIAQTQGLQDIIKTIQTLDLGLYPYKEIERGELVGEGETFWVEKCKVQGKVVAVKRLKMSSDSREEFIRRAHSLLLELLIMHHGPLKSHPNILTLIGYGWNTSGASILPYILVDYCPGGNLRQYLVNNKLDKSLGMSSIQREAMRRKELFIADVAAGIHALHTTGIIHGDVKLDNVLVSDFDEHRRCPVAKVCDFGHSIVNGSEAESQGSNTYRGTTRYNAPELINQKTKPFNQIEMKKCDIWAFGILAWEILIDGSSYLVRLAIESSVTSEGIWNPPGDDRQILQEALSSTNVSLDPIQRAVLKDVLKCTLQYEPRARIVQLNSLLIMKKWRSTGTTNLEAQLALHSGTSEWSYEIFRHDNDREIFWVHKSHIAEDFRSAFEDQNAGELIRGSAAWQLGCCYSTGFGVPKVWEIATEYFEQAVKLGSQVACHFGPLLLNESSGNTKEAYRTTIQRVLFPDEVPSEITIDQRQNLLSIRTVTSQPFSKIDPNRGEDIRKGYVQSIKDISESHSWLEVQLNEVPLIQALRAGNWRATQALLAWGMPPTTLDETGRNMFHWLFMIDDDALRFAENFLVQHGRDHLDVLNQSASQAMNVHPQWPLRLYGTPLMHAIATGSKNTVVALLRLGADPLAPTHTGNDIRSDNIWTALHTAVEYHDRDILNLLLDVLGDSVVKTDFDISTALCSATVFERIAMHGRQRKEMIASTYRTICTRTLQHHEDSNNLSAVERGMSVLPLSLDVDDIDVAEMLLEHSRNLASTKCFIDPGDTLRSNYPIHNAVNMASRRDDPTALAAVELVLRFDPSGLSRVDSGGRTGLHIAASGSSPHVLNFIMGRKPSLIHTMDSQGAFPLHYCESSVTVEQLVAMGARTDVVDKQGRSAVFYAVSKGLADVVDQLCKNQAVFDAPPGTGWSPLHAAISNSRFEIMTILIAYGAQIDLQNEYGDTPLHVAARKCSQYELRLLLDNNADASVRNKLGQLPLHVASTWNNLAAVDVLSNHVSKHILTDAETGANTLLRIPQSPLCICAEHSYNEALHTMISRLAKEDFEKQDRYQRNVLHYAAELKNVLLIRYLVQMAVNLDARDENGDTALMIAIRSMFPGNTLEACETLIDSGASIMLCNYEGEFAWDVAISKRRINVLTLFLSHSSEACRYVTMRQHLSTQTRTEDLGKRTEVSAETHEIGDGHTRFARRSCVKELLQLGMEGSSHSLLLELKSRIYTDRGQTMKHYRVEEGDGSLKDLEDALTRLTPNLWSRLGEPTSKWLTTGWVGLAPEFEKYPKQASQPDPEQDPEQDTQQIRQQGNHARGGGTLPWETGRDGDTSESCNPWDRRSYF